jgi:hypothetical protein
VPAPNTLLASSFLFQRSTIATITPKLGTEIRILVCQIEHMLRHAGSLYDTPDLDTALFLDEFSYCVQQRWGELHAIG